VVRTGLFELARKSLRSYFTATGTGTPVIGGPTGCGSLVPVYPGHAEGPAYRGSTPGVLFPLFFYSSYRERSCASCTLEVLQQSAPATSSSFQPGIRNGANSISPSSRMQCGVAVAGVCVFCKYCGLRAQLKNVG